MRDQNDTVTAFSKQKKQAPYNKTAQSILDRPLQQKTQVIQAGLTLTPNLRYLIVLIVIILSFLIKP